ncbi:hypothetical protein I305_06557 [Cryptococcus gattii E566]|uniref:Uncharacterized protein n=1 Tax=Cryptococcus gattii EJB2 TaxID=1296103 RepID=A0ABR5BX41_9TREE|nr:hypothetical protein I306_02731 [Cryptococcus gattii EJB2]KIY31095.1 hypothetical protein I305_06557 [Cryptococcus gattii E566]KJE00692.1 hypothetical protein I311_05661 [Cryptococcus gattii NT-10]
MLETPKENWSNEDDLHSDALTASHGNEEAGLQIWFWIYGREVLHISKIIAEYVMELSLKMVKNVCETI